MPLAMLAGQAHENRMDLLGAFDKTDPAAIGDDLHRFATKLYPICRSITGAGIRKTLGLIQNRIPVNIVEVPSGTQVFDWTVPKEWNIEDAYIKAPNGERVVDFARSNLHVVSYSTPVHATLPLSRLSPHLFTLPDKPEWIPYRTSYYDETWGFCLSQSQFQKLDAGDYEVCIKSSLENGSLAYGEYYLRGHSTEEVLISCHACHPSLANDNLSGLCVATFLAELLSEKARRYSYRFLFAPGTIGAIAWLAKNRETAKRIRHGLVLTCIGDSAGFHYKKSRRGDAEIDHAAAHALRHCGEPFEVLGFSPYGYDERQFCSPGFNLPVGCLMRSIWGSFPEYHTSADDLAFIKPAQLAGSLRLCCSILDVLENNQTFISRNPFCEPQLGRRKLYRSADVVTSQKQNSARLWVLNLSDGDHSLLDIAERSGLPFEDILQAATLLFEGELLSNAVG